MARIRATMVVAAASLVTFALAPKQMSVLARAAGKTSRSKQPAGQEVALSPRLSASPTRTYHSKGRESEPERESDSGGGEREGDGEYEGDVSCEARSDGARSTSESLSLSEAD